MAIQWKNSDREDSLIASINTTPLVDVMLVLLIIFLITIPVVNSSIAVALPREAVAGGQARPDNVIISVDAQGGVYWFDTRLPDQAALMEDYAWSAILMLVRPLNLAEITQEWRQPDRLEGSRPGVAPT